MKKAARSLTTLSLALVLFGLTLAASASASDTSNAAGVSTNTYTNQCSLGGSSNNRSLCSGNSGGAIADTSLANNNSGTVSARSSAGSKSGIPIDVFGTCRYVYNSSGSDVFVPFKNKADWLGFVAHPPSGVTLYNCSRPQTSTAGNSVGGNYVIYSSSSPNSNVQTKTPLPSILTQTGSTQDSLAVDEPNYQICDSDGQGGCCGISGSIPASIYKASCARSVALPSWTPSTSFTYNPNDGKGGAWSETVTNYYAGLTAPDATSTQALAALQWRLVGSRTVANNAPACGYNAGKLLYSAPTSDLCQAGTFIDTGNLNSTYGPWSWQCTTYQAPLNGPATVTCSAESLPACGTAATTIQPTTATSSTLQGTICANGKIQDKSGLPFLSSPGYWIWNCQKTSTVTGTSAIQNCSATTAITNGQCGSANNSSQLTAPSGSALCNAGVATTVTGAGPWSWTCEGIGSGSSRDSCQASVQVINGQCGSANGASYSSQPTDAQACSSGTPENWSGSGPWSWDCKGINNGQSSGTCSTISPPNVLVSMKTCGMYGKAVAACINSGEGNCVNNNLTRNSSTTLPWTSATVEFNPSAVNSEFCSSAPPSDSGSDGAIATFDLSTAFKNRTGPANIVIPFNNWNGIHSQNQALSVFQNYSSLQSAMTYPNDYADSSGAKKDYATGEIIYIPDVNANSDVLGDVSNGVANTIIPGSKCSLSSVSNADSANFTIVGDGLDGGLSGGGCSDSQNHRDLYVNYNASTKLLTIHSTAGQRWKKSCGNFIDFMYNGYCNGKVWGQVEVIMPPAKCAQSVSEDDVKEIPAKACTYRDENGKQIRSYVYQRILTYTNYNNICGNTYVDSSQTQCGL